LGQGPRVSNLRGFAYHNQDLSLIKNIRIKESVGIQFRAELFNLWNWHIFTGRGDQVEWGGQPFDADPSSPNFGLWNGAVSAPRNIQFALKILF